LDTDPNVALALAKLKKKETIVLGGNEIVKKNLQGINNILKKAEREIEDASLQA